MAEKIVGFVGLGVMGEAMAGHLLKQNSSLRVFNRTRSKADTLLSEGATFVELSEIGRQCDVVILCVSRSEDVMDCIAQIGSFKPGSLVIDHSTIAPSVAKELHGLVAQKGGRFVDAPITGGSMGAKRGQLTIFLGGTEEDCVEAVEAIAPYSKRAERVGGPGSGQMAKMANQIAVAGALLGLCESLSFAQKAGLDIAQVRELVGGGAGGSWNFENYGPKILNRDWTPGFSITNQIKDLNYCHDAANEVGAKIPGSDLTNSLLKQLETRGHGDWTTAALFELYLEPNG